MAEPEVPLVPPIIPPVPPAGAPMVELANVIAVPDIRNGVLADITSAAPREYIPAAYRWSIITGLAANEAPKFVEYVCRAQFVALCAGAYQTMDDPARVLARKKAIVLGSIRAVVMAAYQLTAADMQATEITGSGKAVDGEPNHRVIVDAPGTAAAHGAAWTGWVPANDAERIVMNGLMYLGIGVPALQGLSLVKYGHHYLSNAGEAPKKPWQAMIKQVRAAVTPDVVTYMDYEWFGDVAFHKSCHPILPAVKQGLAKSPAVKDRLVAANLGSAAVRLPATPPDFEIVKASVAVLNEAKMSLEAMQFVINTARLDAAVTAVATAAPGDPERVAVQTACQLIEVNSARIAYSAGIVAKIHESSKPSTLLTAYSMKRIIGENSESYDRGYRAKAALNIREAAALERGEFSGQTWDM